MTDPWDLLPVREVLIEIQDNYDAKYLRDRSYARNLIPRVRRNYLATVKSTAEHNTLLLEDLMKGGWDTFNTLLAILESYEAKTLSHYYQKLVTAMRKGLAELEKQDTGS